jgi:hypothetical protein
LACSSELSPDGRGCSARRRRSSQVFQASASSASSFSCSAWASPLLRRRSRPDGVAQASTPQLTKLPDLDLVLQLRRHAKVLDLDPLGRDEERQGGQPSRLRSTSDSRRLSPRRPQVATAMIAVASTTIPPMIHDQLTRGVAGSTGARPGQTRRSAFHQPLHTGSTRRRCSR